MAYEEFQFQKDTGRKNEENILIELKESPKRFKDLTSKLKLSPMGLTKILKRLVKKGKIEKVFYEGHEAYSLTKEGKNEVENLWYIYHELDFLKENKASYIHNLVNSFTSLDMVILDKENRDKISNDDIFSLIPNIPEFKDFIEGQIFRKIRDRKLDIESSDSKLLMSFEFDFRRLFDFFNKIKIFIDDVKGNIDVLNDARLGIMSLPETNRSYALSSLISNSDYFTKRDKKFNMNLRKYLRSLNDKEKIEKLFGADYEVLNHLIEDIKNDDDPLRDEKISNKLVIKDGNMTYFPINIYLILASIVTFDNEALNGLVTKYSESINLSDLDRMENEVKQ